MFGGIRLCVHMCFLFGLFVRYGYLPDLFMQSVIIPLVKNKSSDLSDINNYRAIASSSASSKLFESLIAYTLECQSDAEKYQFGFKSGHSTGLCTNVLQQTVEYYRNRVSHVFVCFVDFHKAFDSVNYWKLFQKLLDDRVNCNIIRILSFWYSNQETFVRWRNAQSAGFHFSNGTKQGGVHTGCAFGNSSFKRE